jgi:hypothetical protein
VNKWYKLYGHPFMELNCLSFYFMAQYVWCESFYGPLCVVRIKVIVGDWNSLPCNYGCCSFSMQPLQAAGNEDRQLVQVSCNERQPAQSPSVLMYKLVEPQAEQHINQSHTTNLIIDYCSLNNGSPIQYSRLCIYA